MSSLIIKSNTLPEKLLSEWHPIKNDGINPNEITGESYEFIWWQCSEGHEWGATVNERFKKNLECPTCLGMKKSKSKAELKAEKEGKTLIEVDPELAKQWHPTKNGDVEPHTVIFGERWTTRWWKCARGHEWKESIKSRHEHKTVCGYCADTIVHEGNCLATVYPDLAKEWFVFENMDFRRGITPYDVIYNSKEEVSWVCREGHVWKERIDKRVKNKDIECPKCVKQRNSLAANNPVLAKEWHPEKNKYNYDGKTPEEIRINYGKSVWWLCGTCGNEYEASVSRRHKGEESCKVCHPPVTKGRTKEDKPRSKFDLHNKMEDQRILFESNLRENLQKKGD